MDRQLGEAIMIARNGVMESENILNSKDEFSRCLIPEIEMKERYTRKKTENKRERDETETSGDESNDLRLRKRQKRDETYVTKGNVTTRPRETHVKTTETQAVDRPATSSNTTKTGTPIRTTPKQTEITKETQEKEMSPLDPTRNTKRNTNIMIEPPTTNNTEATNPMKHTHTNTNNTFKHTKGTPYRHMLALRPTRKSEVTNNAHEVSQEGQLLEKSRETQENRSNETHKETPTRKKQEEGEIMKHETPTNKETNTNKKRKRNIYISDSDSVTSSCEISKHIGTKHPSITNIVSNQKIDPKQSKIKAKPNFKSSKKANLRPIQANTIKNYFYDLGTRNFTGVTKGDNRSEGESQLIGDLPEEFLQLDPGFDTDQGNLNQTNLLVIVLCFYNLTFQHLTS